MGNRRTVQLFFIVICLLMTVHSWSQPYIDPLQIRYMSALESKNPVATPFTHLWVGSDLPIRLKNKKIILLSPYYEQWSIDSSDVEDLYPTVKSIAFPAGFIFPFRDTNWTMMLMPLVKTNGEELFANNTFQYGGIGLLGYQIKPGQKFRLGVYANKEFFGWFIIPLLGVDWRLSEKDYLFGVLPGRLTYEHKINDRFYSGATFRAPTTSYRLANGQYLRLDDQQLSLFVDYYLAKNICVTLEPGFGIYRQLRTGINDDRTYLKDVKWGDGPFIKLSAAYRIRLN